MAKTTPKDLRNVKSAQNDTSKSQAKRSSSLPASPQKSSRVGARRTDTGRIVAILADVYGDAECALHHRNAFELIIATILSAQCTDERVNIVTKELFRRCPSPQKMAQTPVEELEKIVQSAGFYRNKAKNIRGCAEAIWKQHGGEVPQDLATLITLPGVGRKTANVVLGTAFGIPSGVVVDTHVARLSARLGLTRGTDPVKIEQDLMRQLPEQEWINFSHRLIHHGRRICKARKPLCDNCPLAELCPRVGVAN